MDEKTGVQPTAHPRPRQRAPTSQREGALWPGLGHGVEKYAAIHAPKLVWRAVSLLLSPPLARHKGRLVPNHVLGLVPHYALSLIRPLSGHNQFLSAHTKFPTQFSKFIAPLFSS